MMKIEQSDGPQAAFRAGVSAPHLRTKRMPIALLIATLLASEACNRDTASQLPDFAANRQHLAMIAEHEDKEELRLLLQSYRASVPSIPVQTGEAPAVWTQITIERFGAVRFSSALDQPADLRWAFVSESDSAMSKSHLRKWYIIASKGQISKGFEERGYEYKLNADIPGLDLPRDNFMVVQPLNGGAIEPGKEYILWFSTGQDSGLDFRLTVRLSPMGSLTPADSFDELALQTRLPLPISGMSLEAKEKVLEMRGDVSRRNLLGAIQHAEEARKLAPECRQVLLYLASLYESRGFQLGRVADQTAAIPFFLQAAECMRRIESVYGELSNVEVRYLRRALYNEARAHTANGDIDSAVRSLRQALEAGHQDITDLTVDTEFAALREHPELSALLNEFDLELTPP